MFPSRCPSSRRPGISCLAGPEQVEALAAELRNPKTFGRLHPVPTVSADEPAYDPKGGYRKGAVWPPVNTMVIRGLENNGRPELAEQLALEHLRVITRSFKDTGTVWENYAPDAAKPGKPAKPDLVGWSDFGPILYLIEYAIGIRVDAPSNTITWNIHSPQRVGIERLRFGGSTVSLMCDAPDAQHRRAVRVQSDAPFHLELTCQGAAREADVPAGKPLDLVLGPPASER